MRSYLCESLRELMERGLFEKITIKQICDRAGVIRATFYNYFDDKYDCLDTIVRLDICTKISHENGEEMIESVIRNIEEHREFYKVAYHITGQNSFENMVRHNLADMLKAYFAEHRNHEVMKAYSDDLLSRYFAEGIAFDVREFVFRKDESVGVKEMKNIVLDLMRISVTDLIRTND